MLRICRRADDTAASGEYQNGEARILSQRFGGTTLERATHGDRASDRADDDQPNTGSGAVEKRHRIDMISN
jgi:hypothetical protein